MQAGEGFLAAGDLHHLEIGLLEQCAYEIGLILVILDHESHHRSLRRLAHAMILADAPTRGGLSSPACAVCHDRTIRAVIKFPGSEEMISGGTRFHRVAAAR